MLRSTAWTICLVALSCLPARAETVALWLFDEHEASCPSTILSDAGPNRYSVAMGRGGEIRPGRYGNALAPIEAKPLVIRSSLLNKLGERTTDRPIDPDEDLAAKAAHFGLIPPDDAAADAPAPLHWGNATFAALLTAAERHLRSGGFANPAETRLNLGDFDWTVEFWHAGEGAGRGVLLELGDGPRGDPSSVTRIVLDANERELDFRCGADDRKLHLAAPVDAFDGQWRHWALVHRAADNALTLFVDGRRSDAAALERMRPVAVGQDSYLTIGSDGDFERRLPGRIDELRISDDALYRDEFSPPDSFAAAHRGAASPALLAGPPLLFGEDTAPPYPLGSRKHLFLDDALVEKMEGVDLVPQPPVRIDKAAEGVRGHLSVVDDGEGGLRMYCEGPRSTLAVLRSRDGLEWEAPDVGQGEFSGARNVVIREPVGLGVVFLDPNAPADERWKYLSGVRRQGMFLFSSPDGLRFRRSETAALPFAAGSQSCIYYDDQRQLYAAHHRSDYGMTERGSTRRRFVISETSDLHRPWPFEAATDERKAAAAASLRIKNEVLDPWWLDNGPLCPPGLSIELPTVFQSDDELDQEGTDIYVTKAQKYPWAPDAYVAFPSIYYHYWNAEPLARRVLGDKQRERGSGVAEVQLAVSRDGRRWRRYPRPTYVPNGGLGRNDKHLMFMAYGMVRRGDEIWQFVGGHGGNGVGYHSAWVRGAPKPLYRLVQRVDGFVAAESQYSGGYLATKPFVFDGSRLCLNVDTHASGFVQVGLQDADGEFLEGYHVDDCVYVNGDYLDAEVEWLNTGRDVSAAAGTTVRLYFRMAGSKLYAFEFK